MFKLILFLGEWVISYDIPPRWLLLDIPVGKQAWIEIKDWCQTIDSTTICKLVDLVSALHQADCRIPNYVSAKTIHNSGTNCTLPVMTLVTCHFKINFSLQIPKLVISSGSIASLIAIFTTPSIKQHVIISGKVSKGSKTLFAVVRIASDQ